MANDTCPSYDRESKAHISAPRPLRELRDSFAFLSLRAGESDRQWESICLVPLIKPRFLSTQPHGLLVQTRHYDTTSCLKIQLIYTKEEQRRTKEGDPQKKGRGGGDSMRTQRGKTLGLQKYGAPRIKVQHTDQHFGIRMNYQDVISVRCRYRWLSLY